MKKAISLVAAITLIMVALALSYFSIRSLLVNDQGKLKESSAFSNRPSSRKIKIRYRLHRKSSTRMYIYKRRSLIQKVKIRRAQLRGGHAIYWNGRDRFGRQAPSGNYKLKIVTRSTKNKRRYIYRKTIRIRNNILFSDYFDRPNGLIGNSFGRSDPQGKWLVTNQSFYARHHKGYTNSPTFRLVTTKSNFKNFKLSVRMRANKFIRGQDLPSEYNGLKVFFRWRDQYNLYVASVQKNGTIVLEKKVRKKYTTLGYASIGSFRTGRWYQIVVVAYGSFIKVYLNGRRYIYVVDSSIPTGRVGIRTDNVDAYIDNYIVTGL